MCIRDRDYYVFGNTAPFEYYKEGIKDIIINKRKMELINNTYQQIYLEGIKRNNAEFIKKAE